MFNIRIMDTGAQFYLTPMQVILTTENEKKRKYLDTSVARKAHFIPLCFPVNSVAGYIF